MKKVALFFVLIALFIAHSTVAQRGKIIKSASTTVMDPNQDGFVSKTTAGFSNDGYNVDEFEITMFGIPKLGGDVTGDNIGNACGITDLIPDNQGFSVYAVRDANNNLIFRFRVGDDNPSVESWTILLDTDGLFGDDDPNANAENPGFEIDITLIKRQNAGVFVYDIDGIDSCPTELLSYSFDSHFQISIGDEVTCGDPDFFYDFFVPFVDIANEFGIDINTGLRYVAVTNVSATCAMAGSIADVSGVDNNDPEYSDCIPCAFEDLVNNQCPTAIVDLCETCPGFSRDLVTAPTIDEPIRAGQTQITGTSEENIYIVLKAFPRIGGTDAAPIWSTTARETKGVYAVGTSWEVNLDIPLVAYDKIVARAQKDEFSVPCGGDDNESSSTSITVVAPNDKPIANDQLVDVLEDTPTAIVLTGSDPDADPLTYTIVSPPANGTLSGTVPNITYTPNLNYNGNDSFTFNVSDGIYDADVPGTVTITVLPVNDAPVANNQSVTVTEDVAQPITLTGSDIDGDPLTYTVIDLPIHGILSGTAPNLTYTPALNYNGADSFTFKVNDGTVDSNIATISINITPVQDLPVANDQNVIVTEDISKAIALIATDPDGNVLTYSIVSPPTNGALSGTAPNITYTPAANYNGGDSFTFRANDGTNNSNTATVSITVTPVNDLPIANNQSVTVVEDVAKAIVLTGSDVDGDGLTYSIVDGSANGVLTGVAPNVTYTPNTNFNGSDSFTFRVNDGTTDSNIATVSITVTPVTDAPIANDQNVIVPEDTPTGITLTGSDPDGDAITYSIMSAPANGTLSGTAPNLTYTPNLNYNGGDSFTFRVNDGTTNSNIATVTITVTADNDAPVADNQNVTYDLNTPKAITLTGSDPDGNPLTFTVLTQPSNGTLSGTEPNVTFTPNLNFTGSDSFTFRVNDGTTDSNVATVSLNLTPITNNDPVANDQTVVLNEDVPTLIVLSATDIDGDVLTYSIVTPPANGILSGTGSNRTYTPNLNYNGSDSFTFRVNDGTVNSNIATVSITVNAVNDAPIANPQSVTTQEDTEKEITLTGSDAEGSTLTYTIVSQPAHGTVTGTGATVTYTPALNYTGSDSFTFRVNDGTTNSSVATVSINVTPVQDAPVAINQNVTVQEDIAKVIALMAQDPDGDALTYAVVGLPSNGILSGTAPNLTYTPNLNYNGPDQFTYKVNDGTVDSNIATVSITVDPDNDAPIANSQSVTTDEDVDILITLEGSDIENNVLTFIIVAGPTHGTLSGTGNAITYSPAENYNGPDNFTFKANDGSDDSNIATVSITVSPVNDAPVANDQAVSTQEDVAKAIQLTGSDTDGDIITFNVTAPPANGLLSGTAPNLTYTPTPNFNGTDSFKFTVNDNTVDSNEATVTITISPVVDLPTADNQLVTTQEDVEVPIVLTGNDPDGATLTFAIVASPTHGTLSGSTPNLIYTPLENYNGNDSFTFRVNNGLVNSAVATVSISVTPENDAPVILAFPILYTKEDSLLQVCLDVTDVDGDVITFEEATNTKGGGTMVLDSDPFDFCYVFTPPANRNGEFIWDLLVTDAGGLTGTASVKIIVTPVNDPPVAVNDFISVEGTIQTSYNVVANDFPIAPPDEEFYDIYAEADSVDVLILTSILAGPFNGTAEFALDGTIEYTPTYQYMGPDSIRYRVCDSGFPALCDTAVLFIDVGPAQFKIYEGFSPNGDENNDYWRIDGIEQEPYNNNLVRVFDRFNNLVFETRDYRNNEGNSWRGESNHGLVKGSLPEGTYFYTIRLDNGRLFSGFVLLKRK